MTSFEVGQRVLYELATRDNDSFQMPSTVVAIRPKRIVVEFHHWTDGRLVQRAVRPYRLTPVLEPNAPETPQGGLTDGS